jgi:hypothetical protein
MSLKNLVCACAVFLFVAGTVHAHGPQMQITATNGKIVTREILIDEYTPITNPKSVYVMEVLDYRDAWYTRPETALNLPNHPVAPGQPVYYSGPGIAFGVGHTFAEGSVLSFHFADSLRVWNGTSFDLASPVRLQAYTGGSINATGQLINPTATATDAGPFSISLSALSNGYLEDAHSTLRLRFLGDGATATEPPNGTYLASFTLSSNDPMLGDSDPYYFVMHKRTLWADVAAAVGSLNVPNSAVQVLGVPEPSALILGLACMFGIFAGRRFKA